MIVMKLKELTKIFNELGFIPESYQFAFQFFQLFSFYTFRLILDYNEFIRYSEHHNHVQ